MHKEIITQGQCSCCGVCCEKGGATLQAEDMALVAAGVLPPRVLVTVRAGELAYDEAQQRLAPRATEMIKLAGTGENAHPWHCVFHRADKLCGIHAQRPAQCRALFCRNTAALEALYAQGQATRQDVLRFLPVAFARDWFAVLQAYEEHCSMTALVPCALAARQALDAAAPAQNTVAQVKQQSPEQAQATEALLHYVHYDHAFREACCRKGGIDAADLPFLLGRALPCVLEGFGLALCRLPKGGLGLRVQGKNYYAV
jgi:Fe-S-cluster containining protein